jgi:hypothetical protein
MGALVVFYLRVLFTLIMLVFFGFLIMYFVMSLKLIRLGKKEDNINKKQSAQKSLLWSVAGMVVIFLVWLYIISFIK